MLFRKLRKAEDGAVLVETAIVLPILLLIVWVIIDFARAFYTVNSLASAVREGARVAAVYKVPADNEAAIKDRVKSAFNAFGGPALTDGQIIIVDESLSDGKVTVQVKDYEWLTTTPIVFISGGKILMTRQATFRWEREPT
jgi:Flp pilus assembly protein TadG